MNTDQTLNPNTDHPHDDSPFSPEQLTTWALGEGETLDPEVRTAIAAFYDADPSVRADVEAVRATAALFTEDLGAEPAGTLSAEQRAAILAVTGAAAGAEQVEGDAETPAGPSAPPRDNVIRPRWAGIRWRPAVAVALAAMFLVWIGARSTMLMFSTVGGATMATESYQGASSGHNLAAIDPADGASVSEQIDAGPTAALESQFQSLGLPAGAVVQEAEESRALSVQATPAAGAVEGGERGGGAPDVVPAAPQSVAPVPPAPSDPSRKIIKDATLAIEVANLDLSLSRIGGIAAQAGGYVLETATDRDAGSDKHAMVKIGVPVDQFEVTLGRIREVAAKVISEQSSGVDVSQEFVDLQSRIANLEATQARMRQFLAQATTVEEALRVNAQLSEIEGQLSEVKGRLQYLAGRAAYSTIAVDLRQPAPPATITPTPTVTPTPTPVPGWSPREPASAAFGTLKGLVQTLTTAGIWFGIVILPFALPLALAAWWVQKHKSDAHAGGN